MNRMSALETQHVTTEALATRARLARNLGRLRGRGDALVGRARVVGQGLRVLLLVAALGGAVVATRVGYRLLRRLFA
jgi:hypothetical protein